jgi:DNA-binding GntR family transcriptional regulator
MLPWLVATESEPALHTLRDVPLGRLVHKEILACILRGDLAPGVKISDSALAAKLQVSRMPVREALRELEGAGLVESRKHNGVFVRMPTAREIAELYELRASLDALAGRKVAGAASPQVIQRLEQRLAAMHAAAERKDVLAYYQGNVEFHWDIVSAAGSQELAATYRGIAQRVHLARLKSLSSDVAMLSSLRDHDCILDAIRRRDPEGCAFLMSSHVQQAAVRLRPPTVVPENENP